MADPKIRVVVESMSNNGERPSPEATLENLPLTRQWKRLLLRDGVLYRKYVEQPTGSVRYQYIVPRAQRLQFLHMAHDDSAHSGETKTWAKLRAHAYWPGSQQDTSRYVAACPACSEMQSHRQIPTYPLGSYNTGFYPFRTVVTDILGAIGGSTKGKYAILLMCNFTKFTCGEVLDDTKSSSAIRACVNVFSRWGWPTVLRADAGSTFTSAEFAKFCRQHGVLLHIGPAGRHECVAICERQNSALMHALRAEHRAGRDWTDSLQPAIGALNGAPHATTLVPPSRAVCSYILSNPLSIRAGISHRATGSVRQHVDVAGANLALIAKQIAQKVGKAQAWRRLSSTERGIYFNYAVGDQVLVQMPPRVGEVAKLHRKFQKGWVIAELLGNHCYGLQRAKGGLIRKMHASRVRPLYPLPDNLLPTDGEHEEVPGEEIISNTTVQDAEIETISDVETAAREAFEHVYEENETRSTLSPYQGDSERQPVRSSPHIESGRQDRSPNLHSGSPTMAECTGGTDKNRQTGGTRVGVVDRPSEGTEPVVQYPPCVRARVMHERNDRERIGPVTRLQAGKVIPMQSPPARCHQGQQDRAPATERFDPDDALNLEGFCDDTELEIPRIFITPDDARDETGQTSPNHSERPEQLRDETGADTMRADRFLEGTRDATGEEMPRRNSLQRKSHLDTRLDHSGVHHTRSTGQKRHPVYLGSNQLEYKRGNDLAQAVINPHRDSVTQENGRHEYHGRPPLRRSERQRRQPQRFARI